VNFWVYVTEMETLKAPGKVVSAAWGGFPGRYFWAMMLIEVVKLFDASTMVEIETVIFLG
jgi:hypothetical protein